MPENVKKSPEKPIKVSVSQVVDTSPKHETRRIRKEDSIYSNAAISKYANDDKHHQFSFNKRKYDNTQMP